MKRKFWLGASLSALVLAAMAPWSAAQAGGVSIRLNTPEFGIRIGGPRYHRPPPVYYAPPPVYYAPPPVVYLPPPRRYIAPPPVVYGYPYHYAGGRGYGYHRQHGHHPRWRHERHHRGDDDRRHWR